MVFRLNRNPIYGWYEFVSQPASDINYQRSLRSLDRPAAKFGIGAIVRHRVYPFRGVVVDVDPEFDNSDEWYQSIPADKRPRKDQPFYHLLAENPENYYVAYVSEQNLLLENLNKPANHPDISSIFSHFESGSHVPASRAKN